MEVTEVTKINTGVVVELGPFRARRFPHLMKGKLRGHLIAAVAVAPLDVLPRKLRIRRDILLHVELALLEEALLTELPPRLDVCVLDQHYRKPFSAELGRV